MGTRSITYIYDNNGKLLCRMYRQYDGDPSGHGVDLADFLSGNKDLSWNMPVMAAKLISYFFETHGDQIRLLPCCDVDFVGEEFEYHIHHDIVVLNGHDCHVESVWGDFKGMCETYVSRDDEDDETDTDEDE
jgi:hypothetical protein